MAGTLVVSGIGKILFPSPAHTLVRTLPLSNDRVQWLRSFSGRVFLQSVYEYSDASTSAPPMHDVESVWPLKFRFDWSSSAHELTELTTVAPTHVGTSLLGIVQLPSWLVKVSLTMAMHDDGQGWDLVADVTALKGLLRLIRYGGPMRSLRPIAGPPAQFVPGFHHLVLYDGVCNLCNASVDFVVRHDAQRRFVFVAQQSEAASEALRLAGHEPPALGLLRGEPREASSGDSVLLLAADGRLHEKSAAALRCGLALDWPWPLLAAVGLALPARMRDALYDWVARKRYIWFGRSDMCRLPSADERRRFLH